MKNPIVDWKFGNVNGNKKRSFETCISYWKHIIFRFKSIFKHYVSKLDYLEQQFWNYGLFVQWSFIVSKLHFVSHLSLVFPIDFVCFQCLLTNYISALTILARKSSLSSFRLRPIPRRSRWTPSVSLRGKI